MRGISTDVAALAAILGSAAVAGVVTLGLAADRQEHAAEAEVEDVALDCATTVVETAPHVRVVVSEGQEGKAIVVGPDVSVRIDESCAEVVAVGKERVARTYARLDRARERMQEARDWYQDRFEPIERVRLHGLDEKLERRRIELDGLKIELAGLGDVTLMELEGLDEALAVQLEGLDETLAEELEGLDALIKLEIEDKLEAEMRRLEERLERLDRGNGR